MSSDRHADLQRRRCLLGLVGGVILSSQSAFAESMQDAGFVAVVQPELTDPYREIFRQITEGINDGTKVSVRVFTAADGGLPDALRGHIKQGTVKAMIVLGRQALKSVADVDPAMPIIAGAVTGPSAASARCTSTVCMTPDPGLLFARLRRIAPGIRRVSVVYTPETNGWLMRFAQEAAHAQGLELVMSEARNLATALKMYQTIYGDGDSRRDSVWLPQDPICAPDSTAFPLVLRLSWEHGITTFGSVLSHAERGAVFSLYPNTIGMGQTLARAAHAAISGDPRMRGIQLLRDVFYAVNMRSAAHLGISLAGSQQREFQDIFPRS